MKNLECCVAIPRILCTNCKRCACSRHYIMFKKDHPPAKLLTPSGREIYDCQGVGVSYYLEYGVVILQSPSEVLQKFFPPEVPPTPQP